MSHPILYREVKPVPDLEPWIYCYWQFEYRPGKPGAPLAHSVLPDGCVSLVFYYQADSNTRLHLLSGPRTQNLDTPVPPNSLYLGVRFFPWAFQPLFGFSPLEFKNQSLFEPSLTDSFEVSPVIKALQLGFNDFTSLNQAFTSAISDLHPTPDEKIRQAIQIILSTQGAVKVKDLAGQVLLSERQLQRRFKFQVGLTPKEFIRVRRVRQSIIQILLHEEDFQEVLLDTGYFDHSHFVHDFSQVVGTTPSLYAKYVARIRHEGLL